MISTASVARRLRRHWALVAACALFLLVGVQALDDYLVAVDAVNQRAIGMAALDYLAGEGERAFNRLHYAPDRYYGASFEASLILVERILGLDDGRDVFLSRHLLSHLAFLTGGVFCYLLVLRLFGSRALALTAMALFLLHPRIYAHSFYDSKDVPFLAAFMIALYLAHRAFRRDTLGAFLLCGAGVGLLINLRVMGVILFAAVLAMRALDLLTAEGAEERRRALLTGAAFALAAILVHHALSPILWTDPAGRFAELIQFSSNHPQPGAELFRGEWRYTPDGPPFDYVPVWIAITTPPAVLALAAAGAIALAWRGARRPRDLPRVGPLRFGLLLVAIPTVTAVTVAALENNVYDGWRQLYFLYAPLLLLAVFGLYGMTRARHGRWPRVAAYALAGGAITVTVVSLARTHPNGDASFTFLTDRATPERLASRYWLSGQSMVYVEGIIRDHPSGRLFIALRDGQRVSAILPPDERERFVFTNDFRSGERNFYEIPFELGEPGPCPASPSARYVNRAHAVTLRCVVEPVAYFGELRRRALATTPLDRSRFDAYRVGNALVYVRDGCSPHDLATRFFLYAHPVDAAELRVDIPPNAQSKRGAWGVLNGFAFERLDFDFNLHGVRIDGDCVAAVPLPAWPIARIETGQYTPDWAVAARRAVADAEPAASSAFDLWLDGRVLTYVRDGCSAEDADQRFFLHAHPVDGGDLPPWRAEHGFENLDFDFRTRGAFTEDGACVAVARLPAWPIASVHTGQFATGGGWDSRWRTARWAVRFAVTPPAIDVAALRGEPLARGVFDVWRDGDALVYVKEGCTEEDARTAFFLHVHPVDAGDLPGDRGRHGFDNRDFALWDRGARRDGRCLARVPLPAYAIARVETGQYDEAGRLWTAEFAWPE